MTQVEQSKEQLETLIGDEASYRFEQQITTAILELANALQDSFVDNDMKVSYATHVFAQMLDDLAEIVEKPLLLN